ncbi:MAG: formamidopyrimidine-DNA glycosylase [Armatimonadetes bacterium]|nr:formamidopyrimidine-DNA glycosylase [Armatimonadota bacterium]
MPELPDITVYVAALDRRLVGRTLSRLVVAGPSVLRTVSPRPDEFAGRSARGVGRLGKRIVIEFDDDLIAAIHLMVSGRLHWKQRAPVRARKADLAWFEFETGCLSLTEFSTRKRATIHLLRGSEAVEALDAGGLDVLECTLNEFRIALQRENRTAKRALTDPRMLSGIGNSYSDEILHRARMSPFKLTQSMTDDEACRLHVACIQVLTEWTERLLAETGDSFPEHVTAFRPEMAVHGRFGKPCPVCRSAVQRIVYAENESNYCAVCQMEGRLLADRALSRLLKSDWPATLTELEEAKERRRAGKR